MGAFVKKIGIFFVWLCLFYVLGIFLWGLLIHPVFQENISYYRGAYGHLFSRVEDVEESGEVDIVFVGSSACYRGFDTRIFAKHGLSSFNLGSTAQSHLQTQVFLKQYITRLKPKLVIYEINTGIFQSDGLESALDLLANSSIDTHTIKMIGKVNHLKAYNTFIFSYLYQLIGQHKQYTEPKQNEIDTYIDGGYVERKMAYFHVPESSSSESAHSVTIDFSPQQLQAFEENLSFLQEKQIPFLLVRTPKTEYSNQMISNQPYFDSIVGQHGPYMDFNQYDDWDDSLHFYDAGHLNQAGVERFNEHLVKELLKKDLVGNH